METNHSLLSKIKQLDIVDYLNKLGYLPAKIRGNQYWFHSPFRQEKDPSFKIDRQLNRWYDHGIGNGGNLVDFCILYFNCSVKELLHKIVVEANSLHQPVAATTTSGQDCSIVVTGSKEIQSTSLLNYLEERKIPVEIARLYCKEVNYRLYNKDYYAIGFPNDSGGFELRNKYFKGSSTPKDSSLIRHPAATALVVVEGFFSFLSYQVILKDAHHPVTDFLVLNSLSLVQKNMGRMQDYPTTKLMLDNDAAGDMVTEKLLTTSTNLQDGRKLFQGHKDLNEYLIGKQIPAQQQNQRNRLRSNSG